MKNGTHSPQGETVEGKKKKADEASKECPPLRQTVLRQREGSEKVSVECEEPRTEHVVQHGAGRARKRGYGFDCATFHLSDLLYRCWLIFDFCRLWNQTARQRRRSSESYVADEWWQRRQETYIKEHILRIFILFKVKCYWHIQKFTATFEWANQPLQGQLLFLYIVDE